MEQQELTDADIDSLFAPVPSQPEGKVKASNSSKAGAAATPATRESSRAGLARRKPAKGEGSDSDDDEDARLAKAASLRKRLEAYRDHARFGPVLKEAGFDFAAALRKKKPGDLKKELRRADKLLAKKGGSVSHAVAGYGLFVGEALGTKAGFKLQGFAESCVQDPDWTYQLDRVMLKYGFAGGGDLMDPVFGLGLATLGKAAMAHQVNEMKEAGRPLQAALDRPMPAALLAPAPAGRPDNLAPPPAVPTLPEAGPIPGAAAPGRLDSEGRPVADRPE